MNSSKKRGPACLRVFFYRLYLTIYNIFLLKINSALYTRLEPLYAILRCIGIITSSMILYYLEGHFKNSFFFEEAQNYINNSHSSVASFAGALFAHLPLPYLLNSLYSSSSHTRFGQACQDTFTLSLFLGLTDQ